MTTLKKMKVTASKRREIYIVSSASESSGGFEFKLLDYSYPEIVFNVAWIKNDNYDKGTYEDALDFWLT